MEHRQRRGFSLVDDGTNDHLYVQIASIQAYILCFVVADRTRVIQSALSPRSHSVAILWVRKVHYLISDEHVRGGSAEQLCANAICDNYCAPAVYPNGVERHFDKPAIGILTLPEFSEHPGSCRNRHEAGQGNGDHGRSPGRELWTQEGYGGLEQCHEAQDACQN